jgi:hypothetical protein
MKSWTAGDIQIPNPSFKSTKERWVHVRKRVPKNLSRDFDKLTILVHWKLWKERNSRLFENLQHGEKKFLKA